MSFLTRSSTRLESVDESTYEDTEPLLPRHNSTPLTPIDDKFRQVHAIRGNDIHPLLRESTFGPASLSYGMTDCNAIVSDAARRGKLLMFGDTVQRYPRQENDPVWQNDGDCTLEPAGLHLDSRVIYSSNSRHLISLLSACPHDNYVHYKMALPDHKVTAPVIRDYNLAVRNFCAAFSHMPIVGSLLSDALEDLEAISEDFLGSKPLAAAFVCHYVQALKLDDCRYRAADVVRLLAWTEKTQWQKGYIETFAHCVGMMNHGLIKQDSLNSLSAQSRALVNQSHSEMHINLSAVEAMLADFDITEGNPALHPNQTAIQRSYQEFQVFLGGYYGREFGRWPPETSEDKKHWLTRPLAQRLQDDFGNLYDLLVDDSTHWGTVSTDPDVEGPFYLDKQGGRVPMADCSHFWASTFPLQPFLIRWNKRHDFDMMPHPFPLIPKFCNTDSTDYGGNFSASLVPALRASTEREPTLRDAYLHGTNKDVDVSRFCKAYVDHESKTHLAGVDTHDARLGRWVLIHCIMQLLSRVAIDIQGLHYRNGVDYFLDANLEGSPPWSGANIPKAMRPASIQDSWAFVFGKSVTRKNKMKAREELQRKARNPRFKIEWMEDGRFKMVDSEGRVVFS